MKEIKINQNDANQRLDKFLMKTFPKLGKSMMYKAIRNKKIKVNRKRCTFDQKIQENDSILLFLPPDVLEEKKVETNYISSKLDVIYEDENILIVNKPYGLLSQSNQSQNQDCLVNRVQAYLMEKNEYDPNKEHSFAPSICHRLDRNTTGLVIAAKNANALRKVNEAIANRTIQKMYRAHVVGTFEQKDFTMCYYIRKENTIAKVSDKKLEGYQKALMDVHVERDDGENSICTITLHTGRFHQIRALMGHIQHPLLGDVKYGYHGKKRPVELMAYRLEFHDVDLLVESQDIPKIRKIMEKIEGVLVATGGNGYCESNEYMNFQLGRIDVDIISGFRIVTFGTQFLYEFSSDEIENTKIGSFNVPLISMEALYILYSMMEGWQPKRRYKRRLIEEYLLQEELVFPHILEKAIRDESLPAWIRENIEGILSSKKS